MIILNNDDITNSLLEYFKTKTQGIFNIAYYMLAAASILSIIICGIGLAYSKHNPEKRKQWGIAFVVVVLSLIAVTIVIGLINIIYKDYKPKLNTKTIFYNSIIMYYVGYFI